MDEPQKAAEQMDEDVIELTDIIEKGDAPSQEDIDDAEEAGRMDDLFGNDKNAASELLNGIESDIDDLLSQIEAATPPQSDGSETRTPPPGGEGKTVPRPVNPDETLEMPGIAEVDYLLENLDIPPQPSPRPTNASPAAPEESAAEDLDALLSDILDGPSSQTAETPAVPAENDELFADLDAMLDGASISPPPVDVPVPDIADLPGMSKKTDVAASLPSATGDDLLADLDAMLNYETAAPLPASAEDNAQLADLGDLLRDDAKFVAPTSAAPAEPPESMAPEELPLEDSAANEVSDTWRDPLPGDVNGVPPAEARALLAGEKKGMTDAAMDDMSPVGRREPDEPRNAETHGFAGLEALLRENSPLYTALAKVVRASVAEELHGLLPAQDAARADECAAALERRIASLEEWKKVSKAMECEIMERLEAVDSLAERVDALEVRLRPAGNASESFSGLNASVDDLERGRIGMEERITALEIRVKAIEQTSGQALEQAAATAAARIIREELAALLKERD